MDLFTFAISLLIILVTFQYDYVWMAALIGIVLMFMGKKTSIFIIVSVLLLILFFINRTPYESYNVWVVVLAIGVYLLLNKKEQGSDTYNPEDQYGDLLKGLGGGGGMGSGGMWVKFVFFIIGLVVMLGAMSNPSLLYVGLVIMALSFLFSTNSEKSITKIEDRVSIIDKLDKVSLNVSDNALSHLVEDAMAVTAKITKGAKADVSAKNVAVGTIKMVDNVGSVFKGK